MTPVKNLCSSWTTTSAASSSRAPATPSWTTWGAPATGSSAGPTPSAATRCAPSATRTRQCQARRSACAVTATPATPTTSSAAAPSTCAKTRGRRTERPRPRLAGLILPCWRSTTSRRTRRPRSSLQRRLHPRRKSAGIVGHIFSERNNQTIIKHASLSCIKMWRGMGVRTSAKFLERLDPLSLGRAEYMHTHYCRWLHPSPHSWHLPYRLIHPPASF